MFPGKVFIPGVALVAFLNCNSESEDGAAPSRPDCIVRVDLTWPAGVSYDEKIDVINEVRAPSKLKKLVAGYAIESDGSPDSIYLQFFPGGCGNKSALAEEFMGGLSQLIPGLPPYHVSSDRIYPSTKTIELNGPSWNE